ncbi:chemotaxis response regulator protein-glutamate methylesterase [Bacillus sp. SM2101]|uniref:protein-glutamate methylesterase/protein-glutamine glutaminase n=1 Tax=Bacillaceae TaxID=186817 RepID=UPI001BDF366E
MKQVKVLIVDDSAFMRKLISQFLKEDHQIEVVGTARNGEDALTKIKQLNPDVITMDVEMPTMDGIEALKKIMTHNPIPVIMLSSTTKEGTENTIVAMQYGAIDFIAKPSGGISLDLHKVKDEIVSKVLLASKVNMNNFQIPTGKAKSITSSLAKYSKIELRSMSQLSHNSSKQANKKILCIGTSTGGPRALQKVLQGFPKSINVPIIIVQHMPAGFTKSLASRLNSLCDICVKEGENGEIIQNGTAYIAPGGSHLKVKKVGTSLVLQIDQSSIKNGHRPSVDVMLESVSEISGYMKIAIIMTGMGSDGTEGLKTLKSKGNAKAIAESQDTSIVFGMPKSAIAANVIDDVADLGDITPTALKYIYQ